jgi:hypothetical protein
MAQSPGKFGSPSGWIIADGYNLTTVKPQQLREKISPNMMPSHGIGDSWEEHTPTGLTKAELGVEGGFFDTGAVASHAALVAGMPSSPQATARVACWGFGGLTIGEFFRGCRGVFQSTYEVLATLGELTKANAEYVIHGQFDAGVILQALTQKSADWNTKTDGASVDYAASTAQVVIPITSNSQANPSVVTTPVPHGLVTGQKVLISGVAGSSPDINGEQAVTVLTTTTFSVAVDTSAGSGGTGGSFVKADTPSGGVAYQHVTEFTGLTGFIGKVRDSPDDTTYADLATFANVTAAPAVEAVEVAGTVDRYLSYDGNVTGTGTITAFGGFARF